MSANSSAMLGRSRSLRKPRGDEQLAQDERPARNEPQNVSPSRLPVKGGMMSQRPAAVGTSSAAVGQDPGDSTRVRSRGALGRSNSVKQPAKDVPTGGAASIAPVKSRPLSGQFGRARAGQAYATPGSAIITATSSSSAEPSRPPITTRGRPIGTTSRPPSASGSSSAAGTSMPRPVPSLGLPAPKPRLAMPGHTRSKSSATALTTATTLRPPERSQELSSGGGVASTRVLATATTAAAGDKSRPPSTTSGQTGRTVGLHRRQPSAPTFSSSSAYVATGTVGSKPLVSQPQTRRVTPTDSATASSSIVANHPSLGSGLGHTAPAGSSAIPPRLRPAFNTNQQHYSPAKSLAPKPLISAILAPPSPSKLPANVAATAETARLQTELLQLSLMHRDAAAVDAAWCESARAKLGERFRALVEESKELAALERGVAEARNAKALRAWAGGRPGALEEKIQGLDTVLSGLWTLGEPGGKHARVVRRFERWAERADQILAARESRDSDDDDNDHGDAMLLDDTGELVLVGELDPAWKDDCAALARRLDEWRRLLRHLGDVPQPPEDGGDEPEPPGNAPGAAPSTLHTILGACQSLVADMLAELNTMEQIERDAVAHEMRWIQSMNGPDDLDGRNQDRHSEGGSRAGAIWRAW